jgi:iron complex transport system permease protein
MTGRALLRTLLATAALLVAAWASVALTSRDGALLFDPGWLARALGGGLSDAAGSLLLEVRLPRVISGVIVGACLALAGLVLQGISRNPLADPYLLGVSGGAGLAVVLLHALPVLVQSAGFWLVPTAAFLGAQAAAVLVLMLARGGAGRITTLGLILAGIAVNAFCAALMAFVLARFDPFRVRVTTLWLAGGIGYPPWAQLALSAALALGCWIYLRAQAHRLNALALGSAGASAVGVDTDRLLRSSALAASLLTGVAVAAGGMLGFVGLIVPHAARVLVGADLRSSLPAAAALGSLLLVLADAAARILFAPEELPVGVLTALIGCPVLILLLRAQLRGVRR